MLGKRLTVLLITAFTAIAGAAFAATPPSGAETPAQAPKLKEAFTVLHAVGQWSVDLSKMADERAKSGLVKDYARQVATANAEKDAKLMAVAEKHSIDVGALDPQTEEGKSVMDRMKAETTLLESLQGDAFDKEYMTLVTNTQQSVIHFLNVKKAMAKDPDVKQLMTDMTTTVQNRLTKAQEIMAKIYGDQI